jgi:hypothetical protein
MAKNQSDKDHLREDMKHSEVEKIALTGEEAIDGDTADLESDDDMLENAHDMGLYKGDDGAHPQELNLAAEVQNAEDGRRGMD